MVVIVCWPCGGNKHVNRGAGPISQYFFHRKLYPIRMGRLLRTEFPGALYHVTLRGDCLQAVQPGEAGPLPFHDMPIDGFCCGISEQNIAMLKVGRSGAYPGGEIAEFFGAHYMCR